ncbi:MAG: diguanylate cyclase, partial [Flavobacterium sp.]|nr:diguanylate cyclase [Flavobacterium sp.]
VKRLATTDGLTGLFDRRHFFELAEQELKATKRYKRDLCAIMLDIDHFKKFNDTYGHDIGDEILKLVSSTIKKNLRGADIIGRYGGEEFAILLPETNLEGAKIAAEKLRKEVADKRLENPDRGILSCTVSIGVAELGNIESLSELLKSADNMLYKAKQGGRNLVIWD